MHTDGTDHRQAPAWKADLLRHLGQGGPLTARALTERLQAHHPGLTAEQVERELRACCEVHETAGGWVSLVALADGAVLSHLLGAEERKAGVLAADGDLDLWARLADEGLPLAGGGMLRTRWALSPHELPSGSSNALIGPEGWLDGFENDAILTLRLRDGALEAGVLAEQQAGEAGGAVAERVKTVVQACAGAALGALRAFATAAGGDRADDERAGDQDEPSDPGAALDDVLAELLLAQPGVLDDPMPPLGLLLTAAGLEVNHGAVMLAGAPDDPDEVADLSSEEIRWFTFARGFLWTQEADRGSAQELDWILTVLTLSPLVLERVADEVERNPADAALLEAARRAAATPVRQAVAALLAARAAEGDGRPVEAEELVLEALSHDSDLAPALRDAADYAATRGDAASADAHLRGQVPRRRMDCAGRCGRCWSRRRARHRATARARAGRDASTSSAACARRPIRCPRGRRHAMPALRPMRLAPRALRSRGSTPSWPSRRRPCSRSTWRSSRAASSMSTWTSAGICCQATNWPWWSGGARCRWPPSR